MLVLIDNYDSFTYNLLHRLGEVGAEQVEVLRNDAMSVTELLALNPRSIVLSPGPCTPDQAGICLELCTRTTVPLLGVCLGHQSLAQAFGARIVAAPTPFHGKTAAVHHRGQGLFAGLSTPINGTRYHSLTVDPATVPDCLEVHAETNDGVIMALTHKTLPLYGLQFHPESIASPDGFALLENFLELHQLKQAS
ncbi:MAG: aminodeoxychorismate/anthranilate synthase component II [Alphaproteobacteria bacterium]|nr:aminodeoxychorismate/anthranilate synthase component II [Alphaproteobacteria bacterium]